MNRNITRRILPNFDKTLLTGLVRLNKEYMELACKDGLLSVLELERFTALTKLILQVMNSKGIQGLEELNRHKGNKKPVDKTISNPSIDDLIP